MMNTTALPVAFAQPGFITYGTIGAAGVLGWLFVWKQRCIRRCCAIQPRRTR